MSQTLYYLDHNGILQPGSQVTALMAEIERLRAERDEALARAKAVAAHVYIKQEADLAEAEALLRRCRVELNTVSPEVRKLDGEIDAWLARRKAD